MSPKSFYGLDPIDASSPSDEVLTNSSRGSRRLSQGECVGIFSATSFSRFTFELRDCVFRRSSQRTHRTAMFWRLDEPFPNRIKPLMPHVAAEHPSPSQSRFEAERAYSCE